MILVADNRDSFTWNLVQYLRELGAEVRVERADSLDPASLRAIGPDRLLLGPGPGRPEDAVASLKLVREFAGTLPILGVCLGQQVIALAFGARVRRASEPVHGHAHAISHDGRGLFEGLPDPLTVGRYHSLVVDPDSLPDSLEVSARTTSGEIMGLRHRELSVEAVQFHPESVLSEAGHRLLENFLQSGR